MTQKVSQTLPSVSCFFIQLVLLCIYGAIPNNLTERIKMKRNAIFLTVAIISLIAFVLWTILITFVDVQTIGPLNSSVGFATVNKFFHDLTGENLILYLITDWLSFIPVFIMIFFAILGILQFIKRKNLFKVDFDLLCLGIFYILLFSLYIIFENVIINYRPILIDGILEVSYPSSTTLLTVCVMSTANWQLNYRVKKGKLKLILNILAKIFTAFMVVCRFLSGVHWFSDIVGGLFLSVSLEYFYYFLVDIKS